MQKKFTTLLTTLSLAAGMEVMIGCHKQPVHQSSPGVEDQVVRFTTQPMGYREFDAIAADPKTQSVSLKPSDCVHLHAEGSKKSFAVLTNPVGGYNVGYSLFLRNYAAITSLEGTRECTNGGEPIELPASHSNRKSCVKFIGKNQKVGALACAKGKEVELRYRELYP